MDQLEPKEVRNTEEKQQENVESKLEGECDPGVCRGPGWESGIQGSSPQHGASRRCSWLCQRIALGCSHLLHGIRQDVSPGAALESHWLQGPAVPGFVSVSETGTKLFGWCEVEGAGSTVGSGVSITPQPQAVAHGLGSAPGGHIPISSFYGGYLLGFYYFSFLFCIAMGL